MKPLQDLSIIANIAVSKEQENAAFENFLQQQNSDAVDDLVHKLNNEIEPQIDCTQCGNCCRTLMINVEKPDAARLSAHLELSEEDFYNTYVETSSTGVVSVMSKIPCHFLYENKCAVYEARPTECREFPGLHHPHFTQRLFATFMHYARCPIVFNVIEALKEKMVFASNSV